MVNMRQKVALAVLSAGMLASCGGGEPAQSEAEPGAPVRVQVSDAELVEWPALREATGTVRARTAATIQSKVMGYVSDVAVDAGERVQQGQSLISIDARDLDAAVRQAQHAHEEAQSAQTEVDNAIAAAQAQLDLAQATFRRMKDLYDKNSISDQEFDEVQAKVAMADANHKMALSKREQLAGSIERAAAAVDAAQVTRSYAEIAAPFAGVVTAKMVEPGDMAAPGAPLLTIEQTDGYRIEARLEESLLGDVGVGKEVTVDLEALGETLTARVSEVIPAVDAASRAFLIKIDLPGVMRLRSGLFARIWIPAGSEQALVIPSDAIRRQGQIESVFVVEDGRARARLIRTGERQDDQVEVLSGLAQGESVVTPIPQELHDGSPVEARP